MTHIDRRPILLVEDNGDDQVLTLRALKKQGIGNEIVIKNDGVEALEYLESAAGDKPDEPGELPALALVDLKMPRVDGHEVLKRIKADPRLRRIPVVMLTSSREERDITTSYDLGANSYVRKPVDSNRFNEVASYLNTYWLCINEQVAHP